MSSGLTEATFGDLVIDGHPIAEAFDAVFRPDRARGDDPVLGPHVSGPPTDLDPLILADAETRADSVSVRWYRGLDAAGVVRIFRFQRGRSLQAWQRLLQSQSMQSVAGPFRTRLHAHAAGQAARSEAGG